MIKQKFDPNRKQLRELSRINKMKNGRPKRGDRNKVAIREFNNKQINNDTKKI